MHERSQRFHSFLRSKHIEEFSPTIPRGVGKHLQGVPFPADLHKIPPQDSISFAEAEFSKFDEAAMRKQFAQAQFKTISSSIVNSRLDCTIVHGKELDVPGQFPSPSNFVHFKQCLATKFKKQSEEMGLEEPITICVVPQCLNCSVPSFTHCITHLFMDEKFEQQHFIRMKEPPKDKTNDEETPFSVAPRYCSAAKNKK